MKLWIRIIVGAVLGVILGHALPATGGDAMALMGTLSDLVVHVGRYVVFPLAFFGVMIGVQELREDRMLGRVYGQAAACSAAVTVAMVVIGSLVTLLLAPRRIPPVFQEAIVPSVPPAAELFRSVFPRNLFAVFASDGSFLLPIVTAALLLGLILYREGATVTPALDLADSLARIFYRLNSWIMEALSVGLIAVAAAFVLRLRTVSDLGLFAPLIWVTASVAALFVLVLFPLAIYLACGRYSPFAWLYGMIGPTLIAFFSGDSYFTLGPLTRVAKENYGISREAAAPVLTLATLFAKAGSAMVTSAAFITVLRSYTALEISFVQVVSVIGVAIGISFLLGRVPGATVVVGLSVLARSYGQGMEDIYLILLPALPILTGIAVVVDTMAAAGISFVVAHWQRKRRIVDPLDFL